MLLRLYLTLTAIGILLYSNDVLAFNRYHVSTGTRLQRFDSPRRHQSHLYSGSGKSGGGKGFGKKKIPQETIKEEQGEEIPPSRETQEARSVSRSIIFDNPAGEIEDIAPPSKPYSASSNESKKEIETKVKSVDIDRVFEKSKMVQDSNKRREILLDEKIRQVRDEEQLIASDPSVGAVPELVADRMIGRIATFFGIPVFGGLAIFVIAFFISKKYDLVVPPTIIAYATQVPFVLGLVGISYAILSSSWDEEPGSALGIDEFKTNWQRVQDGLKRTQENAKLKEEIEKEQEKLGKKRRK